MSQIHAEAVTIPGEDARDPRFWTATKRNRYAWTITVMMLLLMMLSWADKAVLGLAAVPIMRDLNITPEQFGLVGSGMFLTFGLAQLFAAPLANRLPTRWILLVLCLMWSVAQVPILLFATLPALWLSRLLLGAGEGPLAPVMMHGLFKWFPAKRGALPTSIASAGVTLGTVAFAPVLMWMITTFGWRSAFIAVAVIGVVWSIVWLIIGKEGPYTSRQAELDMLERDQGVRPEASPAPRAALEPRLSYWRIMSRPSFYVAALTAFFGYWTFTLAIAWAPAYFENGLGFSTQAAGSLIVLPSAWGAICTIGLCTLAQRLVLRGVDSRYALGWMLGATAAFTGLTLLLATLDLPMALKITLLTFGFGTAPALFALSRLVVVELTTVAQRGAVLSYSNAILTTGGVFAPAVAGFLIGGASSEIAGYNLSFVVTSVFVLIMAVLCFVGINQRRDRRALGLEDAPVARP